MSASPDVPAVVKVTVVTFEDGRPATPWLRVGAVVAVLITVGAAVTVTRLASHPARPAAVVVRASGPTVYRLAQVYRYPLGCLGGAGRGGACLHYGAYVTAILARVHGSWGLALEAVSRACPKLRLPAAVRAQLVLCLRPHGGRQHVGAGHALKPRSEPLRRVGAQRAQRSAQIGSHRQAS